MDIVTATEDHILRTVAGVERKFYFLTAYDRAELLRRDLEIRKAVKVERKQKLIDNLKLAGISGEQMLIELENFDDAELEVTEKTWVTYVNSVLNEADICKLSLAKTYPDDVEAIAKQTGLSMADKAKLCGLTIVDRNDQQDDPDPNAPRPATYETPATENVGMNGPQDSLTGTAPA